MKKKIVYVEPADYFPKELRKKYKLGEYADTNEGTNINEDAVKTDVIEESDNTLEMIDNDRR